MYISFDATVVFDIGIVGFALFSQLWYRHPISLSYLKSWTNVVSYHHFVEEGKWYAIYYHGLVSLKHNFLH
jgi:hypothetical protein